MQTPTKINIPKHIDIGRLIGRDGRNLKPIAKKTGTYISVNTIAIPAKFEIKLDNKSTLPPSKERIKEAIDKLEALLKIKGNEMQSLPEKKKKKYMIKSHTKSHGQCNKQKAKRDAPLAEY
ncbi:15617_t:CDS:2 [Rhizophagus irregularis]|nr:15617_t:CDS:2 [Rhizophagus irregularis]